MNEWLVTLGNGERYKVAADTFRHTWDGRTVFFNSIFGLRWTVASFRNVARVA